VLLVSSVGAVPSIPKIALSVEPRCLPDEALGFERTTMSQVFVGAIGPEHVVREH